MIQERISRFYVVKCDNRRCDMVSSFRTQKEAEDAISEVSKDDSKTQDEKEYIVERQKGKEIFADFLTKFVDVFDHEKSASKILLELWEFVRLYTYKKNRERGKLSESIYTQVKRLEYYDKERSFEDRLTLIEDFLNQLTVNDEPEGAFFQCETW